MLAHRALVDAMNATNSSDATVAVGWVNNSDDRGTLNILADCLLTIFLCIWVSVYPNCPAPGDTLKKNLLDKLHLASVGILGPDFLFTIATGQLGSAKKSVKVFKELRAEKPHLQGPEWTVVHGFWANSGYLWLLDEGYGDGFPIDAEQLHYLVLHDYADLPPMTKREIDLNNKQDALAKILTVCQVVWFVICELNRIIEGMPITTLELTTLSYAWVMLGTSVIWFHKPMLPAPTKMALKNGWTVDAVRHMARQTTHPDLPSKWFRTPLSFISRSDFHFGKHWEWYLELAALIRFKAFHRPMTRKLWNRFPTAAFAPPDLHYDPWLIIFSLVIQLPFSISFLAAWNFQFPTHHELTIWRITAVYLALYSAFGAYYYIHCLLDRGLFSISTRTQVTEIKREKDRATVEDCQVKTPDSTNSNIISTRESRTETGLDQEDVEAAVEAGFDSNAPLQITRVSTFPWTPRELSLWFRNISPDQDPDSEVLLRWVGPITIASAIYVVCRLFVTIEDIISLRSQPETVYSATNGYLSLL